MPIQRINPYILLRLLQIIRQLIPQCRLIARNLPYRGQQQVAAALVVGIDGVVLRDAAAADEVLGRREVEFGDWLFQLRRELRGRVLGCVLGGEDGLGGCGLSAIGFCCGFGGGEVGGA
jgi:hypothetical protein